MARAESETLEFKREVTQGLLRTVVAFANSRGGRILVGVDDDGTVVGVEDPDDTMLRITSLIRDGVCPELLHCVHVRSVVLEGLPVVEVEVERGEGRPYCLAAKGLVPSGVYVRVGPGNSPLSHEGIRRMVRESDGDSFEARRSLVQDLSFDSASRAFAEAGLTLDDGLMRSLGMRDASGRHTNLALLLSDQNPHVVRCACFLDDAGSAFQERADCTGSVFDQLDQAMTFFRFANHQRATFEGLRRADRRDYPEGALREALVNAVAHRDYDREAAVLVRFYATHVDFVSPGSLVDTLTLDDLFDGVSDSRNPRLGLVLYRLGIVEALGTGIPRMVSAYADHDMAPRIKSSAATFFVSLPNLNERPSPRPAPQEADDLVIVREERLPTPAGVPEGMSVEDYLIEFAHSTPSFTREDAQTVLGRGRDATLHVLNGLVDDGRLVREGSTRSTRYRAV